MSEFKKCSKCGEAKPATREFFGNNGVNGRLRNDCRVCCNARSRSYAARNPESVRRRAENRQRESSKWKPTKALKEKLFNEQKGICGLCGKVMNKNDIFNSKILQVEHLTPVSKGGSNEEFNLIMSHRQCNQEKANKTLLEYLRWRRSIGLVFEKISVEKLRAKLRVATNV